MAFLFFRTLQFEQALNWISRNKILTKHLTHQYKLLYIFLRTNRETYTHSMAHMSQVRPRSRAEEWRSQFEGSGLSPRGQDPTHLGQINPFARGLRQLGQEPAEDVSLHVEWNDESSEIRAIIHCGDSSVGQRTVVFWKRSELAPTFMSPLDRLYESLQYPLFFPHFCCGWFPRLTSTRPSYQRVTQIEYYRQWLLAEPRFGLLGRLLNEYLVDMFSSVEDNRLNYVRQHFQTQIAAQCELDETIEAEGGARAGRVYLPASFMGSPRMQRRLIANWLAMVRRLGKPTYFIMVNCNPNWPEIRNHPKMHCQNASDRPDKARDIGYLSVQLRALLVTLIVDVDEHGGDILESNRDILMADLDKEVSLPSDVVWNRCLRDLANRLETMGRTMTDFGLPEPADYTTELAKEQLHWDHRSCQGFADAHLPLLTPDEQLPIYEEEYIGSCRAYTHNQQYTVQIQLQVVV